jgi:hypothetical protein
LDINAYFSSGWINACILCDRLYTGFQPELL